MTLAAGALAAALAALLCGERAGAFECKAAIVFALDLSSSVDPREQQLQFEGLSAALSDPEVRRLILSPPDGIAASAFTWSGAAEQRMVAEWSALDSNDDVIGFASLIAAAPRLGRPRSTAVGRALAYAAGLHRANPYPCERRIIDVAGDGVTNDSIAPHQLRQAGLLDGLEINALVIRGSTPDPLRYYAQHVIQGPNAFALDIDSYDDYADGMRRKLLRELRLDVSAISP